MRVHVVHVCRYKYFHTVRIGSKTTELVYVCVCLDKYIFTVINYLVKLHLLVLHCLSLVLLGPCTFRSPESQKESKHCPKIRSPGASGCWFFRFPESAGRTKHLLRFWERVLIVPGFNFDCHQSLVYATGGEVFTD